MSETPGLAATRAAYDAVAARYAELFTAMLDGQPLDRALLTAFAELVQTDGGGLVADVGCGPGQVTGFLSGLGLRIFGVDLSPAMVALAREAHPGLRFDVGAMARLPAPTGGLAGIVSWYSIIHAGREEVAVACAEFARALAPGGPLLIGFFAADEQVGPPRPFDHRVVSALRWPVGSLAELLVGAGFTETARLIRPPGEGERFSQARLLMRRAG